MNHFIFCSHTLDLSLRERVERVSRPGRRTRPGSDGGAPNRDNDRRSNPNRGRAGLERALLELSSSSCNYASAASLS